MTLITPSYSIQPPIERLSPYYIESCCDILLMPVIAFYESVQKVIVVVREFFVEMAKLLYERLFVWETNLKFTILQLLACSIVPSRIKYTKAHIESIHQFIRDEFPSEKDSDFRAQVVELKISSDGHILNGVEIINTKDPDPCWVVFFLPNLALWEDMYYPLREIHKHTGANILCYNYRSCGLSEGTLIWEEDLIADGVIIMEHLLRRSMPEQILVHGFSIGGGVATQVVQRLAQKGIFLTLCNERSFSSIAAVIMELFPNIIGYLLASAANCVGWVLNSELALQELKHNNIIVVSNEKDDYVKKGSQFIEAVNRAKAQGKIHPDKIHEITMDPEPADQHSRYWLEDEKRQYIDYFSRLIRN